jgi:transcription-repair coupling factor (superfamily II helicase)
MPDVHQRLYFYKRFAQASTDEDLDEVRAEIIDRFGDPPAEVDALCEVMQVKVRLRALRIRALEAAPGRLVFTLGEQAALDPFQLAKRVQQSQGAWRLTPEMKLVVTADGAARAVATPAAAGKPVRGKAAIRAATQQAVKAAVAAVAGPSPAQEEAKGREILTAVRKALGELAKVANA